MLFCSILHLKGGSGRKKWWEIICYVYGIFRTVNFFECWEAAPSIVPLIWKPFGTFLRLANRPARTAGRHRWKGLSSQTFTICFHLLFSLWLCLVLIWMTRRSNNENVNSIWHCLPEEPLRKISLNTILSTNTRIVLLTEFSIWISSLSSKRGRIGYGRTLGWVSK